MDEQAKKLIQNWQSRNIKAIYCRDSKEAAQKLIELIPLSATVGFSGSRTLEQMQAITLLEEKEYKVYNPYIQGLSREESLKLRKLGSCADYYLASPNAVSIDGELVFFSAYGNRTAGVSYAEHVIAVCGINKITDGLTSAIKRSREYATPLNCKRLNWNSACLKDGICHDQQCLFPEYKRMCCQILIIEAEALAGRMSVLLIDEELGF